MTMGKWPRSRFIGSFAGSRGLLGKARGVLLARSKTLPTAPRSPWACWRAAFVLASFMRIFIGARTAARSGTCLETYDSVMRVGNAAYAHRLMPVAPFEGL